MRLLERVAIKGVRFPVSLIMLSKMMFTLEGLLSDIVGSDAHMGMATRGEWPGAGWRDAAGFTRRSARATG